MGQRHGQVYSWDQQHGFSCSEGKWLLLILNAQLFYFRGTGRLAGGIYHRGGINLSSAINISSVIESDLPESSISLCITTHVCTKCLIRPHIIPHNIASDSEIHFTAKKCSNGLKTMKLTSLTKCL